MKLRYIFLFVLSMISVDLSMLVVMPGLYELVFTHAFGSNFQVYSLVPYMALLFLVWIIQVLLLVWLLTYHS